MGEATVALLSWITSVTSVSVQMVGLQICLRFFRKGNTGDISNLPFLSYFISACLWLRYGLLIHVNAIVVVNSVSALLQFAYMTVFYYYSLHRATLYKQYLIGCFSLFSVLSYIKYYVADERTAIDHLGVIGCLFAVMGYVAPLATLRHILRTKSTDSMSFLMCVANFVLAIEWGLYGYVLTDLYVALPNVFGFLLGILQFYLFIKFPSREIKPAKTTLA